MNRLIYLAAFALVSCGDGFYDTDDLNLNVDLVVDQIDGSQAEPEYSDYRLIFTEDELKLKYGKKGIGGASDTKVALTKSCWAYNWGTGNTMEMPMNYEFIAMQWSSSGVIADSTIEGYEAHIESGDVLRILGYNEPDSSNQSNMSVATAINAWPQLQNLRIPLASPAVTDNAEGTAWMNEFMEEVIENDFRVDYIAVHCYSCKTSLSSLKSNLQKDVYVYYKDEDGRVTKESTNADGTERSRIPVLLTEFASTNWDASNVCTEANVIAFINEALPWLEETEWIYGYAWFSFGITTGHASTSALWDDDFVITPTGQAYQDLYPSEYIL